MSDTAEKSPKPGRPRSTVVRWLSRLVNGMLVLCFAGIALALVGLSKSTSTLQVVQRPSPADVIVVLGGETVHRPERALELFKNGIAPRILVSGTGDCQEVRRFLVGRGVPESAIELECDSRNTKQNAEYSVRLLREAHVKKAIIVTSWFHSRRALNCFQHFGPGIELLSCPTTDDVPRSGWPSNFERGFVLLEYVKLAYYWPRYGIKP